MYCVLDMYMNVLKGKELRRREEGVRRKLRDCAGEHDGKGACGISAHCAALLETKGELC